MMYTSSVPLAQNSLTNAPGRLGSTKFFFFDQENCQGFAQQCNLNKENIYKVTKITCGSHRDTIRFVPN